MREEYDAYHQGVLGCKWKRGKTGKIVGGGALYIHKSIASIFKGVDGYLYSAVRGEGGSIYFVPTEVRGRDAHEVSIGDGKGVYESYIRFSASLLPPMFRLYGGFGRMDCAINVNIEKRMIQMFFPDPANMVPPQKVSEIEWNRMRRIDAKGKGLDISVIPDPDRPNEMGAEVLKNQFRHIGDDTLLRKAQEAAAKQEKASAVFTEPKPITVPVPDNDAAIPGHYIEVPFDDDTVRRTGRYVGKWKPGYTLMRKSDGTVALFRRV